MNLQTLAAWFLYCSMNVVGKESAKLMDEHRLSHEEEEVNEEQEADDDEEDEQQEPDDADQKADDVDEDP